MMISFQEFLSERRQRQVSATQLKVGQRVIDHEDPLEVLSKPKQDGTGYWVNVLNLRTQKKTRIYIESGDTITLDE